MRSLIVAQRNRQARQIPDLKLRDARSLVSGQRPFPPFEVRGRSDFEKVKMNLPDVLEREIAISQVLATPTRVRGSRRHPDLSEGAFCLRIGRNGIDGGVDDRRQTASCLAIGARVFVLKPETLEQIGVFGRTRVISLVNAGEDAGFKNPTGSANVFVGADSEQKRFRGTSSGRATTHGGATSFSGTFPAVREFD